MKRVHTVLVRYIIIFLAFSALILLAYAPVYRFISDFTLNNEIAHMEDKLRSGTAVVDSAVTTLKNTTILTSKDSRFRILKYKSPDQIVNPYTLLEMKEIINSMALSSPLIADAGIIFSEYTVLTRSCIFYYPSTYSFYGHFLKCSDLSWSEWLNSLLSKSHFMPTETYSSADYNQYDAITFSSSSSSIIPQGNGILYATFPVNNLISLIADSDIIAEGFIQIKDSENNIIYRSNYDKGETFHLITNTGSSSLLTFEIGIPDSLIQKKLQPIKRHILIFILISVSLTVLLSLIFAFQSSRPIRKIFASIDTTKTLQAEYERNKLDTCGGLLKNFRHLYSDLERSISAVDTKLEDSLQIIENQTRLLKTQFFTMAFQKGIYDPEEYKIFQSVFPDFPSQFSLAIVRYDSSDDNSLQKILISQFTLMNAVKSQLPDVYSQGVEGNAVILLLPCTEKENSWYNRLQALRSEINRQIELPLIVSLSDIFDKPSDLPRAWQQLQFMGTIPGTNYLTGVEQMNTVPLREVQIPLNINMTEMIYNALYSGNEATACAILKDSIRSFPKLGDPLILNFISNMLSNMITQLKLENPQILFDIDIPIYIQGKHEYHFSYEYPECFKKICKNIKAHKEKSISNLSRKILDYIDQHLYDSQLYITMVSEHFNISAPTLQKIIKGISGQTFLAYVEGYRLKKARELLTEGKYAIQKIALDCGFSNTNSFYKAFRRHFGFSPSKIQKKD